MASRAAPDAPPPMITCVVAPKLTFSVPRDTKWHQAKDIPQSALQRGFAHRFPLPPVNLDKLRFESVSPKVLDDTAVYRLTSCEEADERILASLLKGLEDAVDGKHRMSLERARTDLLSSSATFQVLAGEVQERQKDSRQVLDREVLKLNATLATTSKRLFLLERENASLKTQTTTTRATHVNIEGRLGALESENNDLRTRNLSLEGALATLLETVDAHAARLAVCERRPSMPPPPASTPRVAGATQTELVVVADAAARIVTATPRAPTKEALSPRAAPFAPAREDVDDACVAEYKAALEDEMEAKGAGPEEDLPGVSESKSS